MAEEQEEIEEITALVDHEVVPVEPLPVPPRNDKGQYLPGMSGNPRGKALGTKNKKDLYVAQLHQKVTPERFGKMLNYWVRIASGETTPTGRAIEKPDMGTRLKAAMFVKELIFGKDSNIAQIIMQQNNNTGHFSEEIMAFLAQEKK